MCDEEQDIEDGRTCVRACDVMRNRRFSTNDEDTQLRSCHRREVPNAAIATVSALKLIKRQSDMCCTDDSDIWYFTTLYISRAEIP